MSLLKIDTINDVPVIASTLVATELGVQHKNLLETISKYQTEIESSFGLVAFETEAVKREGERGIKYAKVAYLTEDQAIFIATLSRNTEQVVKFKADLVYSFQTVKRAVQQVTAGMTEIQILAQGLQISNRISEELKSQLLLSEAKLELQETIIKNQAPKAEFYDKVLETKNSMPTTFIAAELGLTPQALNKLLKEKGIQYKVRDTWVLTSKYAGFGYIEMKTVLIPSSTDSNRTTLQMCWTQKGRELIHSLVSPVVKLRPQNTLNPHLSIA